MENETFLSRNEIVERIKIINEEMLQVKANYSKLEGHMGEAQFWLSELIKKEESEPVKEEEPAPVECDLQGDANAA